MMNYCKRCGEPIRFFRGYLRDVGEICYTCYLEYLMAQKEPEKVRVKAVS